LGQNDVFAPISVDGLVFHVARVLVPFLRCLRALGRSSAAMSMPRGVIEQTSGCVLLFGTAHAEQQHRRQTVEKGERRRSHHKSQTTQSPRAVADAQTRD
jgi:hypothetical protein